MSDSHSEDQDRQENRPFIKETVITEEQKPSLGKKLLQTSLLAFCFGVIAAFAFHIVHTRLDPSPEETSSAAEPISFPEDTDPAETSESQSSGPSGTTAASQPSSYSNSESGRPWSGWREDVNALIGAHNLEIKDYKQLYTQMNSVSSSAHRSMVTVTATNRENTFFQDESSYATQSFGVIVYSTDTEYLILTPYSSTTQLSENSSLSVTFADFATCDAYIKATDGTADLMLLAVSAELVPESTRSVISVMRLGNSYGCTAGQPVIALGAPIDGIIKSYNYGMLTYVNSGIAVPDNTVSLLYTSLIGDESSRGFLIDLDGRLIGWIDPEFLGGTYLTAVGISDLKNYIENLSNGYFGCYLGIEGITVTAEVRAQLGAELDGVIISRCLDGSPASAAGLQRGDIITVIGGTLIRSMSDLRAKLLSFTTEQTVTVTVQRLSGRTYREISYDVKLERR